MLTARSGRHALKPPAGRAGLRAARRGVRARSRGVPRARRQEEGGLRRGPRGAGRGERAHAARGLPPRAGPRDLRRARNPDGDRRAARLGRRAPHRLEPRHRPGRCRVQGDQPHRRRAQRPDRVPVQAVTRGIDALGEVTIRVRAETASIFTGRGAHSDIIVASAKAYTNALNRLLVAQDRPRGRGSRRWSVFARLPLWLVAGTSALVVVVSGNLSGLGIGSGPLLYDTVALPRLVIAAVALTIGWAVWLVGDRDGGSAFAGTPSGSSHRAGAVGRGFGGGLTASRPVDPRAIRASRRRGDGRAVCSAAYGLALQVVRGIRDVRLVATALGVASGLPRVVRRRAVSRCRPNRLSVSGAIHSLHDVPSRTSTTRTSWAGCSCSRCRSSWPSRSPRHARLFGSPGPPARCGGVGTRCHLLPRCVARGSCRAGNRPVGHLAERTTGRPRALWWLVAGVLVVVGRTDGRGICPRAAI